MNRYSRYFLIILLISLFLFSFLKPVSAANTDVRVEFFYSQGCPSCDEKKLVIDEIEHYFGNNITVSRLLYKDNKDLFYSYGFTTYPAVVVKNQTNTTKFTYIQIYFENLNETITAYIAGSSFNGSSENEGDIICQDTPFGRVCIDPSELSIPVLTIILAGIDSINPCSFFVLLFLLSLLLHTKSRKRMMLVGGLFIFFSAFIYFLIMVIMMFVFKQIEEPFIIILIGGIVAVVFGILNIKEFFFFKKGPSLSIPESKKPKLYSRMRNLIKIKSVTALIIATIVLAISANMVELICSLNLPVVYTGILVSNPMGDFQYILYLILYNIIYIVPLLILVIAIVATLGRWKLTELQGRKLKLFSGTMIFLLGVIMLTYSSLLKNVFTVIIILLVSVLSTIFISVMRKKFVINDKSNNQNV